MERFKNIPDAKKYDFFSDCHHGGVNPKSVKLEFGKDKVHLQDNVEVVRVPKRDSSAAIARYLSYVNDMVKTGTHFVSDNHAGRHSKGPYFKILDGHILITHGHCLWKDKTRKKWANKEAGSWWGQMIFSRIISRGRHLIKKTKLKDKEISKLLYFKKKAEVEHLAETGHGVHIDTVVLGHTHPNCLIDVIVDGIRYVNVMEGKTTLYFKRIKNG